MAQQRLLIAAWWLVAQPANPADCPSGGARHYESRTFLGYACEDGCERHKRGYAWAEAHAADSPASCRWLGTAEAEGCKAYVEAPDGAESAGFRWALENEISSRRECGGAGAGFLVGCERAMAIPLDPAR